MSELICEVCGMHGPNKFTVAALTWDWFHGYLDKTFHFCPAHRHSAEHDELFRLSRIKSPEPECKCIRDGCPIHGKAHAGPHH